MDLLGTPRWQGPAQEAKGGHETLSEGTGMSSFFKRIACSLKDVGRAIKTGANERFFRTLQVRKERKAMSSEEVERPGRCYPAAVLVEPAIAYFGRLKALCCRWQLWLF